MGTITGTLDTRNDSVAGRIYARWFTQPLDVLGQVWACCGAPEKRTTAPPDGSIPYMLQWDPATEFDIQPGQDVAAMYVEPDGDRVINIFREPVPNLRVEKWAEGNAQTAPGGAAVYTIHYRNDGDGVATSVLLTDTLPALSTYVADSSGVAASVETGSVR